MLLVNRSAYIPTQFTPCDATPTPTATNTPTTTPTATPTSTPREHRRPLLLDGDAHSHVTADGDRHAVANAHSHANGNGYPDVTPVLRYRYLPLMLRR